jgi:hypothetical protein
VSVVGRANVHDGEGSRRPSLATNDMKERVNAKILGNRRIAVNPLQENFGRPEPEE